MKITEHEKSIKVIYISFDEEDVGIMDQRVERLCRFAEHLGFLISALLDVDGRTIRIFLEPHTCPCAHIPYRESIKLIDTIAIEDFCKKNGLTVIELIGAEEYNKRIIEAGSTLDEILNKIEDLN